MKLILAEKPSVAKNIADALGCKIRKNGYLEGKDYIVTWAFGHLLTLYDCKDYDSKLALWNFDNFPYIPDKFQYKIKSDSNNKDIIDSGSQKQINIIKSLIESDNITEIISATDYDREGELIAYLIFKYLKTNKPIYRILINEWTPDEIKRGLSSLKTYSEMKNLQAAGISRQLADWVIGINFTSISTLKYTRGKKNILNVGRVLMPTLKMIYDRYKKIESFNSEKYFELYATFKSDAGIYIGKFFHDELDKFSKEETLVRLSEEIKDKQGIIINKNIEIKKEASPRLFNLSDLQGYITSKNKGWTADKVLKVAQSLYENKFITYPRTESTVLEESIKDKARKVLEILKKELPFKDEIIFDEASKIFNSEKVQGHSAIIPTYILPTKISKDEETVYNAVKNRFISQFMPHAEFENTEIITSVQGKNYPRLFITKGRILITKGWLKLYEENKKEELLPPVSKGDIVEITDIKIESKKSKPPAHYTEKTLLKAMETCGRSISNGGSSNDSDILPGYSIGTAATRAETINKLKYAGYITAKGKSLIITPKGIKLIEVFPVKELLDSDYTGKLEKKLYDIEMGIFNKDDFLKEIYEFTKNGVLKIKTNKTQIIYDSR